MHEPGVVPVERLAEVVRDLHRRLRKVDEHVAEHGRARVVLRVQLRSANIDRGSAAHVCDVVAVLELAREPADEARAAPPPAAQRKALPRVCRQSALKEIWLSSPPRRRATSMLKSSVAVSSRNPQ